MEIEVGQIVKLSIPHFRKDRYYLVYQIDRIDYILVNITDRDKRESIKIPQYKLITELDTVSFVNLNTKILVHYELLSELIDKLPQQNKNEEPLPTILKEELDEIIKGIVDCFSNDKFRGNRYEVRVK